MLTSPSNRNYPKPPITEAIIDLRVDVSPHLTLDELKKVHMGEEGGYPEITQVHDSVGEFKFGADPQASAFSNPMGFIMRSADGKQIHQARLTGFSMSRLAPYEGWSEFRNEAYRLWSNYRAVVKPKKITRIAIRNINRIDIPLPISDFSEYLDTFPQVSSSIPQGLSAYVMQLAMPLEEIHGQAIINEAIIEPVQEKIVSVVIDIDVFRTEQLPMDDEEVWSLLDNQLRHVKDNLFEGCITENARRLFI